MRPLVIAVDFDGTCVDNRFPDVGPEAPGCVEVLREWVERGHRIVLLTIRGGKFQEEAVRWFVDRQIPLAGIGKAPGQGAWTSSRKCYANAYVDDAAVGAPLWQPEGFHHRVIDWATVRDMVYEVPSAASHLKPLTLNGLEL